MTQAKVSINAGNHESILGRNLIGTLGMELVQRGGVMRKNGEESSDSVEGLDELQTHFCKLYPILFTKKVKSGTQKSKLNLFEALKPIQQKSRRVPISLQDKVD